jgi:hypothetical protein
MKLKGKSIRDRLTSRQEEKVRKCVIQKEGQALQETDENDGLWEERDNVRGTIGWYTIDREVEMLEEEGERFHSWLFNDAVTRLNSLRRRRLNVIINMNINFINKKREKKIRLWL